MQLTVNIAIQNSLYFSKDNAHNIDTLTEIFTNRGNV